jgi:hypothetical protein
MSKIEFPVKINQNHYLIVKTKFFRLELIYQDQTYHITIKTNSLCYNQFIMIKSIILLSKLNFLLKLAKTIILQTN